MPANKKYLTKSPWQRFAKISAAILGSWLVTVLLHLALAGWFDRQTVLITSTYSTFILWAALMILAFLGKNGWKVWLIYFLVSVVLFGIFILGITLYPEN
ncbi:MAG TPA: hypothetical protein VFM69_07020 [Pricia sp.]|nr:hypothetical protein [Pricia sp.]